MRMYKEGRWPSQRWEGNIGFQQMKPLSKILHRTPSTMVQLSLLYALSLATGVLAAPSELQPRPQPQPRSPETKAASALEARQGYYFQNWSEGGSNIRCINGAGGSYTADWSSKGGFVCGKGWNGGGAR